jgi:hypothetical protein
MVVNAVDTTTVSSAAIIDPMPVRATTHEVVEFLVAIHVTILGGTQIHRAGGKNVCVTSLAVARKAALALSDTTEQDHHGMASFRVKGKIFATVPDPDHLRVMLSEEGIRAAVAEHPGFCEEGYWGARLATVVVTLSAAPAALVKELLSDAWFEKGGGASRKAARKPSRSSSRS